jgi:hypothetical protein
MPDVHVPKIEGHGRGKTALKIVLEVALISVGVFLGLLGEQWRETVHQHALAKEALRRFRAEIVENRKAIADVADYHVGLQKRLAAALDKESAKPSGDDVHMHGIRPANFDHAAWDLAIATQSLAYIDPDLALGLSSVYNFQARVSDLSRGVLQAMYVTPPMDDQSLQHFYGAVLLYYNDMTVMEPALLKMYDEILPQLDKAIGGN